MTRITILLGGIALFSASVSNAQLIGGGGIGGMAGGMGNIGGGVTGSFGGAMGRVDGDVQGSLHNQRLRDAAHADRVRAREARAEAKAARRNSGGTTPAAGSPMATQMAAASGAVPRSSETNAGGMAQVGRPTTEALENGRGRSFAARAELEAGQRGLRRAGRSPSGVAVYVPAVRIAALPTVYDGSVYGAGGGTYVYGGGFYEGDYRGSGVAAAPVDDRQYRELQRDTEGTGVTVERRGADLVMELPADVTFAFNRADIQPRFVPALDAVARTIAAYPATDVEVIGHTDAIGSDAYNFALSQRRGASVADFLVGRRTDPERLVVEGLGKTEPVASNATVAGRAANRRVEIVLHGHEG